MIVALGLIYLKGVMNMTITRFEDELMVIRTKEEVIELENKMCKFCFRSCDRCPVDEMIQFHIDHVMPKLAKMRER